MRMARTRGARTIDAMRRRHGLLALAAVLFLAGPLATSTPVRANASAAPPATAALTAVRDRAEAWLHANRFTKFKVDEVMAFTNNDYVAVGDSSGTPAFELLVAPNRSWLMEEPASMMWNTKYGMLPHTNTTIEPIPGMSMMWGSTMIGMMGSPHRWYSSGAGAVSSIPQAVSVANRWLARARPGEVAENDGRTFPGYYTLDTTSGGQTTGMLSVNKVSGAVWYHGWHGRFLAERDFTT
jgi:hypothetical protein